MVRAAAVYVIVLMLPLAFAAFVWPARRIWAVRSVELLIALILSKFVIVAVLSLGGAAFSQSVHHSVAGMLAGVALLALAGFAPWALLRLLPMTELASAAAGLAPARGQARRSAAAGSADGQAHEGEVWAAKAAQMRREARADARHARSTPSADRERLRPAESAARRYGGCVLPPRSNAGAEATVASTPTPAGRRSDAPTQRSDTAEPALGDLSPPARRRPYPSRRRSAARRGPAGQRTARARTPTRDRGEPGAARSCCGRAPSPDR